MNLFTATLICFLTRHAAVVASQDKCCDFDEHFQFVAGDYSCVRDPHKRFGIIADRSNFFKDNLTGECVEALNVTGVFLFKVTQGKVIQAESTHESYFPKCCPVGHIYNSVSHACKKSDRNHTFIGESFVKVGLPHCKVVVDFELSSERNNTYDYCIDEDQNDGYVRRECRPTTEICSSVRCIKKCCPDGQSFKATSTCHDTYIRGLEMNFSRNAEEPFEPFAVISNRTCKRIYRMSERRYIFTLQKDGVFKYWDNRSGAFEYEGIDSPYPYCIEHANIPRAAGYYFFKCFVEPPKKEKFEVTKWPKIISCIFLLLTMAIYIMVGETKNLFGKILMNYCVAILMLYAILLYTHLHLSLSDLFCTLAGYALIFVSTVSFTWLNIMCCDIWFTFGTTRHSVGSFQRRKDVKRLLIYMTYGWGAPMFLTLVVYLFALKKVLPDALHPYVGHTTCLIDTRNYAPLVFLRIPHLIIQVVNIVLFVKTITYCLKIKDEINRINDTTKSERKKNFKRDKERFALIVKLAVIMGVTFIFETTSGFVKMSEMGKTMEIIEIVWDFINCCHGVFIFIIFICKKKIYKDLLRKMGMAPEKKSLHTQSTVTSIRTSLMKSDTVDMKKM